VGCVTVDVVTHCRLLLAPAEVPGPRRWGRSPAARRAAVTIGPHVVGGIGRHPVVAGGRTATAFDGADACLLKPAMMSLRMPFVFRDGGASPRTRRHSSCAQPLHQQAEDPGADHGLAASTSTVSVLGRLRRCRLSAGIGHGSPLPPPSRRAGGAAGAPATPAVPRSASPTGSGPAAPPPPRPGRTGRSGPGRRRSTGGALVAAAARAHQCQHASTVRDEGRFGVMALLCFASPGS